MLIYEKNCLNTEGASVTMSALESGETTQQYGNRVESLVYLTGKKGL
jgi:hypothetical protein